LICTAEEPVDWIIDAQAVATYPGAALPDFAAVKPKLRKYLDSLAGYRKNVFAELPEPLRDRLIRECRHCYEAWGYAVDGLPSGVGT
jgi:hypothetical protein